jgi:2-polyprenyl-3-methyl-5-hydroxy-6-metoxy-1,4-benzoquinol methylase
MEKKLSKDKRILEGIKDVKKKDEIRFEGSEAYEFYPKILRRISLSRKEKILDVGCGVGKLSRYLKGFDLYGCDVTENFVKQARKESYKEVKMGDIYKLPYKDKEFDKILCFGVFEYLNQPEKAMKELLRVCKGKIILNTPNYNSAGIANFFFGNWGRFIDTIVHDGTRWTNKKFHKRIAKRCNLKLKIMYFSRNFELIRDIWGNIFAGDIIAVYWRQR